MKLIIITGLLILIGASTSWLFYNQLSDAPSSDDEIVPESLSSLPDEETTSLTNLPEIVQGMENSSRTDSKPQTITDPFVSFMSRIIQGSSSDIPRLKELYEGLEDGPEKYAAFFSLTCREYESQMFDYERQKKYRREVSHAV